MGELLSVGKDKSGYKVQLSITGLTQKQMKDLLPKLKDLISLEV